MKSRFNINKILGKPVSAGEQFLDKTKRKAPLAPFYDPKDWPSSWTTTYFKEYPRLDKVFLPEAEENSLEALSLGQVLSSRVSTREFGETVTLEQISNLLKFSVGMKSDTPPYVANRYYASPGARYGVEVYLVSLDSDLPRGLYHYNVKHHYLEVLDNTSRLNVKTFFNQDWISEAGCVLLLTGVFYRSTIKYGQRGYRHVLVESGHMGQNLYLVATALDMSGCSIGIWSDQVLEEWLDIDGVAENIIYAFAFGNKAH